MLIKVAVNKALTGASFRNVISVHTPFYRKISLILSNKNGKLSRYKSELIHYCNGTTYILCCPIHIRNFLTN